MPDGTDGARIVSHDVESALGIGESKGRVGFLRRPLRWLLPALLIVAGALYLALRHRSTPLRYQTVNARRGDLTASVIATGTLAALDTVVVGTEVSGVVDVVAVDYNDHVRLGQTLAVVNTDQLQAQIRQSEAAFQATKATAQQMAATLAEIRPQAVRAESLFRSNFIARQDLESAQASLARAVAAEANARALVAASGAALQAQRTILRKATIRSPITGVVLQREIEPGRTVAASFQTPVLFVLAADLKRMTLALDIDEADVGQVQAGQQAEFTVDAYPDRVFAATVHSVRNAARTVEGVVTYQAILDVANPDLALRPGMTATSTITAAQVRDALLVPNAALRYSPLTDSSALPSAAPTSGPRTRAAHQLWVLRDGKPVAIPVSVRMTDGQWTELTEGAVAPGTPLITGVMSANASKTTDSSSAPRSSTPMRFPHGS
ncbi:MAG: efflux RND transporter periplasmic adaptor subunit [Gemmatimonadaceae bacterium]|nr:efflux RND transporter periplasmic adaptor subunit [Gemmatimonadaceae bacterium]